MSATPAHSERYVDFDEYVEFQLEKTRKSIRSNDLLTATAVAAAIALAGALSFVVLDHWVVPGGFSVGARWCWFLAFVTVLTGWIGWKIGIPTLRTVNRLFAAKELEHADPLLRSNLLNYVDLRDAGRSVHPAVMQTIERQAATRLSKIDVGQAVDHRPLLKASYALLAIVVLFCAYALLSPKKISSGLWRMLPFTASGAVTRTVIQEVTPGDATLLARGQFPVSVVVTGEIPPEVQMLYTTADGRVQDEAVILRPQTEGLPRFVGTFAGESGHGVLQDFSYVIVAGDARSRRFRVSVHHPPSATVHQVSLTFPEYMKLEDSTSLGGHIDGWEGAVATIAAVADKPCRSAVLQFLNDPQSPPTGEEVLVEVKDGTQLTATWKLDFRSDGSYPKHYRIQCRNDAGEVDPAPAVYNIAIKPDRPPEVVLLHPERDLEAPANAVIPLLVQASDPDFELGYINLQAEKGGQSIHRDSLSEGRQQKVTLKHNFELSPLGLQPGDEIQFWIEAFDNKQPRRNRKNTPRLKVRITEPASKEDVEQQLAEDQKERDQRLAEAQQEQNRGDEPRPDVEHDATDDAEREPTDRDSSDADRQPSKPGEKKENDDAQTAEKAGGDAGREKPSTTNERSEGSGQEQGDGGSKSGTNDSPLSDDGEDDAEALRQIFERLKSKQDHESDSPQNDSLQNKQNTSKGSRSGSQQKPEPSPEESDDAQRPNGSENESDADQSKPSSNGGKTSDGGQDPSAKNPNESTDDEKSSPNSSDSKTGEEGTPRGKPSSETSSRKPNSQGKTPGGDTAAPMTDEDGGDREKPAGPKTPGAKDEPQSGRKPTPAQGSDNKASKENAAADEEGDQSRQNPRERDAADQAADDKAEPRDKSGLSKSGQEEKPRKGAKGDGAADKRGADPSRQKEEAGDDSAAAGKDDQSTGGNESAGGDSNSSNDRKSGQNSTKPKSASSSKNSSGGQSSSDASDSGDSDSGGDSESDASGDSSSSAKPAGGKESKPGTSSKKPKSTTSQKSGSEPKSSGAEDNATDPSDQNAGDGSKNKRRGEGTGDESEKPASKPKAGKNDPNAKQTELENGEEPPKGAQPKTTALQKTEGDPNAADEELVCPGAKDGQKSDQPSGGEGGGSKQDRQGNSGSPTEGPGEKTDRPGEQEAAQKKTGTPDPKGKSGEGSKSKAGAKEGGEEQGKKSGGKEGNTSDQQGSGGQGSEASQGEPGSESAEGGSEAGGSESPGGEFSAEGQSGGKGKTPGKKPGKLPGGQKPDGATNPLGGDARENGDVGGGNGEAIEADPEAANLEFNRQAAELVLQRVQDDLNAGKVDQKLLEELGWTPEQLQRFAERLARQLSKPASELTPEDEARRRQFEEMLKSIDLKGGGVQRSGEHAPKREVDQSGARRAPVPVEYRAAWEALTKTLSKKKGTGSKEAAPKSRGP